MGLQSSGCSVGKLPPWLELAGQFTAKLALSGAGGLPTSRAQCQARLVKATLAQRDARPAFQGKRWLVVIELNQL